MKHDGCLLSDEERYTARLIGERDRAVKNVELGTQQYATLLAERDRLREALEGLVTWADTSMTRDRAEALWHSARAALSARAEKE